MWGIPRGFLGVIPRLPAHSVSERVLQGLMPTCISTQQSQDPSWAPGKAHVWLQALLVSWELVSRSAAAPEVFCR